MRMIGLDNNIAKLEEIMIIDGHIMLSVFCPYCGCLHTHGSGSNINEITNFVSSRGAHCDTSKTYIINDYNGLVRDGIFTHISRPIINSR